MTITSRRLFWSPFLCFVGRISSTGSNSCAASSLQHRPTFRSASTTDFPSFLRSGRTIPRRGRDPAAVLASTSKRGIMSDGGEKDDSSLPRIDGSVSVGRTKWVELRTLTYTDQEGKERKWDYVTRTTKRSPDKPDAVIVIPLLQKKKSKKTSAASNDEDDADVLDTILVEQFRPPVGRATLEFPAGLIDRDETAETAALRELREETGYVGSAATTPPTVSRAVCMSPGLADETVQVVLVHVDLDRPDNVNPQPQPDAGEHIKVHRVSLKEGIQSLLDRGSSPMAIQGLYLFAMGLEIGKSMQKK